VALSIVAGVARPPRVVFLRGDESEVQRRKWRGPRALCYRGGDCEAAFKRSGFCGITPSGGEWCCSSMAAVDPAWQWSSRCGAVRIFQFPVDAGSRLEVLDNYMSVDGLVGVAGSVSAAFVAWTFSKPDRDRLWRCCEAASMPQSDRSELLSNVEFDAC